MPIIIASVVVIAIVWILVASSRSHVDKDGTTKCAIEKQREGCTECCNRYGLVPSFSAIGNECKCLRL
jgi:hypothetical protein